MKIPKLILLSTLLLAACGQDELTLSNGETANLNDYKGQWLWLNYYADWCKPCIKELPALDVFSRGEPQRQVLSISFDNLALPELQASWRQHQVAFMFARVESESFRLPRPKVLPTTYVLNPQGELVATLVGEQDLNQLNATWLRLSGQSD